MRVHFVLLLGIIVGGNSPSMAQMSPVRFEKLQVTTEYLAEGCGYGDFDRDGSRDLVCGPFWFKGPDFKQRHKIYDGKAFPNDRGYSDNFFSYVADFDRDGWDDVLKVGLPGTPAYWFRNPRRKEGTWAKRLVFPIVDNEAPTFADIDRDGRRELLCTFEGRLGYLKPKPGKPDEEWTWTSISDKGKWHKYSHGLGAGDVNGDGRVDFLMPEGWWAAPADDADEWKANKQAFANGGAQIYVFDVDGDGDNDVVSSQNAHAYGLKWFEQSTEDGVVQFKSHEIMPQQAIKAESKAAGVSFSQLHAIDCDDIDGDGRTDIVAGKCYWAHNGSDPGARDPAVIYWFRNTKTEDGVKFVPHLIDDQSGVGRGINIVDMNGDGRKDVIVANKKGTFVFLQLPRTKQDSGENR
ncbi:MAG: FG-GAP repeat domain-containing protein [Planctomycetaceae bacterium]